VADDGAVTAMAGRVRSEFGRLDALVNNAGTTIKTPPADLDGLDMAGWDRVGPGLRGQRARLVPGHPGLHAAIA